MRHNLQVYAGVVSDLLSPQDAAVVNRYVRRMIQKLGGHAGL